MPNFLENLRLRNIFEPNTQSAPDFDFSFDVNPQAPKPFPVSFGPTPDFTKIPSTPTPPEAQEFDPVARMRELYQPEMGAQERFNQLMLEQPKWEKPGVWRTIAAALSAFGPGGHDTGMKVAQQPYLNKVADWKSAMDPAYQAANLERQENINRRQLAHQTVQSEVTSRRDEARAKTAEEANRIRQQRADVYEWKSRNPAMKIVAPKGGNIKGVNPITGQTIMDFGPAGTMSDADRMDLEQTNQLERIGARTEGQVEVEGARQENRRELAWSDPYEVTLPDGSKKYMQTNRATGDIREAKFPGTINKVGTGKTDRELPTQTKVRQYNAAKEFAARNPQLAKFIKFGKGNDFSISLPSKGGFFSSAGPTEQEYQTITQGIFGNELPFPQPTRTGNMSSTTQPAPAHTPGAPTNTPAPSATTPPKLPPGAVIPQGRIAIADKTGKIVGTVPASQAAQAESEGYTLVK